MSVQISGSTLFNVLQVTQEFFSLTLEAPKKEKWAVRKLKFCRVKGRKRFPNFSQNPLMLSRCLIYRFPLSALTVSEGTRWPAQPSVCSFQNVMLILTLALRWMSVIALVAALCQRSQPQLEVTSLDGRRYPLTVQPLPSLSLTFHSWWSYGKWLTCGASSVAWDELGSPALWRCFFKAIQLLLFYFQTAALVQ